LNTNEMVKNKSVSNLHVFDGFSVYLSIQTKLIVASDVIFVQPRQFVTQNWNYDKILFFNFVNFLPKKCKNVVLLCYNSCTSYFIGRHFPQLQNF